MRSVRVMLLLLACVMALSSCGTSGAVKEQVRVAEIQCPALPEVPPELMKPPSYGQQVRAILFGSPTSVTPTSEPTKP